MEILYEHIIVKNTWNKLHKYNIHDPVIPKK